MIDIGPGTVQGISAILDDRLRLVIGGFATGTPPAGNEVLLARVWL